LLAIESDAAKPPLQKTFRRASRSAFLRPAEAGADWLSTQECAKLFIPNQSSCEHLGKDFERQCI
jgi:hypothetical protein